LGFKSGDVSPTDYEKLIAEENEKIGKVVKISGNKPDRPAESAMGRCC
jgi:hypothetical protein